jgi:small basic protein (TIGR04137 family)
MSIDKSLRRKSGMSANRSVLTRDERIKTLKETDRWIEGRSPYGLPKVRVLKIVTKKAKKEKAEGDAAADAKAPAGGAAKPAAKPAAKAAEAKKK